MDLVHVCYDDRYWSKILLSTIPTPMHGLKVKVTGLDMLTFYAKVFRISLFPNPFMDLFHIWYDYRYWFKILISTIFMHDLKVTDFYAKVLH